MGAEALLSELGLDGPLPLGVGRRALPLRATYAGELSVDDLVAARDSTLVQKPSVLKTLRQSHHVLARVLAQGTSNQEAAAITGYDPARIAVLKGDPAFTHLLDYYKKMEAEQYSVARADMHERLSALGFDAVETLHQKLVDEPEAFTTKELLAIVEATSDRTGHGKTSTVNSNVTIGLSEDAIARVKSASVANDGEVSEEHRSALLRLTVRRTAGACAPEEEPIDAEWSEAPGDPLREEGPSSSEGEVAEG